MAVELTHSEARLLRAAHRGLIRTDDKGRIWRDFHGRVTGKSPAKGDVLKAAARGLLALGADLLWRPTDLADESLAAHEAKQLCA